MATPLGDIDPRDLTKSMTKRQITTMLKAIQRKPRKRRPMPMKAFRAAVASGIAQANVRKEGAK